MRLLPDFPTYADFRTTPPNHIHHLSASKDIQLAFWLQKVPVCSQLAIPYNLPRCWPVGSIALGRALSAAYYRIIVCADHLLYFLKACPYSKAYAYSANC